MKNKFKLAVCFCFLAVFGCGISFSIICGNGVKEGLEQCDNGQNNSDTKPNACRTDCTLPVCGDYVVDSGEECDKGSNYNSDKIPGACRRNCKRAHCGDGVLDLSEGEECDDGNTDPYDGCNKCRKCYKPKDNLAISGYEGQQLKLCAGNYEFEDKGSEGIIILNGQDYVFYCEQGSALYGVIPTMQSAVQGSVATGAASKGFLASITKKLGRRKTKTKIPAKSPAPSQGGSGYTPPRSAFAYQGTGILINGTNIAVRNCHIEGFKYGVKFNSPGNMLLNNNLCTNSTDIKSDNQQNYGAKNKCSKTSNWQENGQSACSMQCN